MDHPKVKINFFSIPFCPWGWPNHSHGPRGWFGHPQGQNGKEKKLVFALGVAGHPQTSRFGGGRTIPMARTTPKDKTGKKKKIDFYLGGARTTPMWPKRGGLADPTIFFKFLNFFF
jgi:hypothetical protein